MTTERGAAAFIAKWQGVNASELSTSQSFLIDLCALLDVPAPHATAEQDYMFERPITFAHGDGSQSAGRIDLYRRGHFVLESKKVRGVAAAKGFDDALLRARSQAEGYARALPASEGRPPFVVVVDVGNRIELYAEFSRSGATYTPFPDPRSHRIALSDLADDAILDRLRRVWTDPLSLDPSRQSAKVTREIAERLAELAKSLERAGHAPESVAQFLMRCLFTMFAEDVRLLPEASFRDLLQKHADKPEIAMRMVAQLWRDMDQGGFSAVLAETVLQFNGKLFKQPDTLPLDAEQLQLLIAAARTDWKHVEPAIFGTLLERALSSTDRHKLGAHYTPRAYVERLVLPTVIDPLRSEWSDVQAAALTLALEDKHDEAVNELRRFHHRLCTLRVLDPACGSGNFLYVTLEHLKRLEGEVLNALDELGFRQAGLALDGERADALGGETVDPHNLLGIELNPRAAAIAEVVLWIGYLQWHFRTRGDVNPPTPVIRDFRNIENRDAILAFDRIEHALDEQGRPVTRWDGRTMKTSPITGEAIPDDSARVPLEHYVNPRQAEWPKADYIVGNPPFIGNKRMRLALGDGYVDALRGTYHDVPDSADLVMYWWHKAAWEARAGGCRRFGLITTNSIRQSFNRRVIAFHTEGPTAAELKAKADLPGELVSPLLSIAYVIPDHPWVDASDGAAVRIALTVCGRSHEAGIVDSVVAEESAEDGEIAVTLKAQRGMISSDLSVGARVLGARKLRANENVCFQGMNLVGKGFRLEPDEVVQLGYDLANLPEVIKPHCNARDLMQGGKPCFIIDFFGLTAEQARTDHPALYQILLDHVRPEREHNNRKSYREKWWMFGEARGKLRASWSEVPRVIITPETSKHRVFQFVDRPFCPDHKLYAICIDDTLALSVLSTVIHKTWAIAAGGRLGVGNDPTWTNTTCFLTFPFPAVDADSDATAQLRSLGKQLDSHRKRQQSQHPELTLTGMYNVLEKLRSGDVLTSKERVTHEQGLVSVLRQIHDDLDAAVLAAYGWSDLLPVLRIAHGNDPPLEGQSRDEAKAAFGEAILGRLVALNAERVAEEARGIVRWLRPEFQNPDRAESPEQVEIDTGDADRNEADDPALPAKKPSAAKAQPWPKETIDQVRAVAEILAESPVALSLAEVESRFSGRGAWKKRLPSLLQMLVVLGRAADTGQGFIAR